jgi:hypothetical protein
MNLADWHPREVPITTGLMRQKKESLRGNFQWLEPLLQSGTLSANYGRPNRITTGELLRYVKTFRGLEYATDESIASFLYDDMRFIPELAPEGNKFRGKNGGPRGWEFLSKAANGTGTVQKSLNGKEALGSNGDRRILSGPLVYEAE